MVVIGAFKLILDPEEYAANTKYEATLEDDFDWEKVYTGTFASKRSDAAETVTTTVAALSEVAETVEDAASDVADAVGDAVDDVKDAVADVVDEAKDALEDVAEATEDSYKKKKK